MSETETLFRPVGSKELQLIERLKMGGFPPRLPDQPIFYPVTNEAYAVEIAQNWNAKHNDDRLGFVTRFEVKKAFLARYEPKSVGARRHTEYWIPAEALGSFNANIVGKIEVVARFDGRAHERDGAR